jgi:hypothetical protein
MNVEPHIAPWNLLRHVKKNGPKPLEKLPYTSWSIDGQNTSDFNPLFTIMQDTQNKCAALTLRLIYRTDIT